jgi:hypothetical protein
MSSLSASVSDRSVGSSKSTSHASHSINRASAKLAVDVLYLSNGGKVETEAGKKYVTLQGDFGDDEYENLFATAGLTLLTINYCQRGLEGIPDLRDLSTWGALGKLSTESLTSTSTGPGLTLQVPEAENIELQLKVSITSLLSETDGTHQNTSVLTCVTPILISYC